MNKSVPNTEYPGIAHIYNALEEDIRKKYPVARLFPYTLTDMFSFSKDDYFDPKYKGNKKPIICFRNYGIHNSRRKKIEKICLRLEI